tara:strand:- start:676 stop:1440 length:765 start_codon:yes stop_codon:yes gene_type:complete
MSEIRVNKIIDEAGTGAVELTEGATLPSGKTLSGAGSISMNVTGDVTGDVTGNITGTAATFSGSVSIGGTLTYEDVKNVDSVGLITARSGISVTGGNTTIKGAVETVNTGAYASGTVSGVTTGILTLDTETGTVFSHDLQSGAIGLVSITNFPASANSFHTVTLILEQGSTGTAHTLPGVGLGTQITLTPSGVSGFSTSALVGSATTVTLSTTADDIHFITFGIHYNGSGTGTPGNYKTFITKNGDYRYGTVGF